MPKPAATHSSATPISSSARSALPGWMMPTPSGECSSLISTTSASMPRRARAMPSDSPPIPPPTTRTDRTALMSGGEALPEQVQPDHEEQESGDAEEQHVRYPVLQPYTERYAEQPERNDDRRHRHAAAR